MAGKVQYSQTITLEDIAQQVGVSRNTVSLALRDSDKVTDETKARIKRMARQLGYVPNYAARNLRIRRSGIIGIYTLDIFNAIRAEMVAKLLPKLHTPTHRPILGLGQSATETWVNSPWIQTFLELKVEALVIIQNALNKKPYWLSQIPTIAVTTQPDDNIDCDLVGLDRYEAASLGAEYLVKKGHKKIIAAAVKRSYFMDGSKKAIESLNAQCVTVNLKGAPYQADTREIIEIMKSSDPPSAVLAGDTIWAVRLINDLTSQGIGVPQDLAVVSYDFLPLNEHLKIPITTIEQPVVELVETTSRFLTNRLKDPKAEPQHTVLKHKLAIRQSS